MIPNENTSYKPKSHIKQAAGENFKQPSEQQEGVTSEQLTKVEITVEHKRDVRALGEKEARKPAAGSKPPQRRSGRKRKHQ